MISFFVIVGRELFAGASQLALTEHDEVIEAFYLDRQHEPFGMGIQIGRPWWQAHGLYTRRSENLAQTRGEEPIAVADQIALSEQEAVEGVGEVPRHLLHPLATGVVGNADDVYSAHGERDDEEHVVPDQANGMPDLNREEVGRCKDIPVSLQELLPRGETLWCWLDAIPREHVGDELAMPQQQGIRRDDSVEPFERRTPQLLRLHRQPAALVLGTPQPPVLLEMLLEHRVLSEQVLESLALLAVHPSSHGNDEKQPSVHDGAHPVMISDRKPARRVVVSIQHPEGLR